MLHDNEAKKRLGYKDKGTKVYPDGREVLKGKDWKQRMIELDARSEGRCEYWDWENSQVIDYALTWVRCHSIAHDPHHIVKRSKKRDDRLQNLVALCRRHHNAKHPEKNKIHWSEHVNS